RCQCGQPVFFRNSRCLACDTPLGYDCERGILLPLMPGPQPDTWQEWQARSGETGAPVYKRCRDLSTPAACNWLIPVEDPQDMCRACRLNRTIPDLTDPAQPDNGYLWGLLEQAKRRLVSSLILLKLPVASRMSEDPERGLMFDFLRSPVNGLPVVTGHDTGLITLNVDEADDAKREAVRKTMREPYRTLLGHFRHEVGHYYWGRLIAGTPWLEGFHELFGDESADYMASLQRSYYQGPPSDWPLHFVSAYASTHPWEDWAECWAHYLHMRDAIDTALSFGLSVDRFDLEFTPFTLDALYQPDHPDAEQFLAFLNHWTQLTTMLNEMSRSMGQPDFYPFVLSREVVGKLHFIHLVVNSGSWLQDPVPLQP
ncbi:MAG: zinc-binding metallopeptidase family protein, partial [Polaromonas sp.]